MFRKLVLSLILVVFVMLPILAQEDDDTTTTDEATSTFTSFIVICSDRAVINLSGTIEPGFDMYFQVFSGPQGSGEILSGLRQVPVNGEFTFSESVPYPEGNTIAAGAIGSVYVAIARENDSANTAFSEFTDDIQDGCAEPINPIGTSTGTDGGVGTDSAGTGTVTQILSPFGGFVNPGYVPAEKPVSLVGPRENFELPRHATPGVIFAECDDYPVAEPGILYDTDTIFIFWSWFAETEELVLDHIENVDYSVTYYQVLPLPDLIRTEIREIDGLFWVFYYSNLGNLRPGQYYIEYKVRWDEAISDGFESFGPGTANPQLISGCSFDIRENPQGLDVSTNPWPYQFFDDE